MVQGVKPFRVVCVRESILGGGDADRKARLRGFRRSALSLGSCPDVAIELRGKAKDGGHAFRLEPDEQDHIAIPQLVVLGDDIKLVGVERGKTLQVPRALLKGLEIAVCKVIEFGVHLLDGGEDHAFRLANDRRQDRAVAIVIGGAVRLNERPELLGKGMEAGKSNQRNGEDSPGGEA